MARQSDLDKEADEILRADTGGSYYLGYVKTVRPVTCPNIKGAMRAQRQDAYAKATAAYMAMPKEERRQLSQRYKAERERGEIFAKSWSQWLLIELGKINHGLSLQ
jgi:hypothetical protein